MTALAYSRMRGPGDFDAPAEIESDDRVSELAERIVDERASDARCVAEALDELAGTSERNSDGNTHFAADLAAALLGSDKDAYFARLMKNVREYLMRDALTEAEAEVQRTDEEQAEARDMSRWAA